MGEWVTKQVNQWKRKKWEKGWEKIEKRVQRKKKGEEVNEVEGNRIIENESWREKKWL